MKRHKVEIEVIPDDSEGEIDLAALESMLSGGRRKPALIAITHAPTNSGMSQLNIQQYTQEQSIQCQIASKAIFLLTGRFKNLLLMSQSRRVNDNLISRDDKADETFRAPSRCHTSEIQKTMCWVKNF